MTILIISIIISLFLLKFLLLKNPIEIFFILFESFFLSIYRFIIDVLLCSALSVKVALVLYLVSCEANFIPLIHTTLFIVEQNLIKFELSKNTVGDNFNSWNNKPFLRTFTYLTQLFFKTKFSQFFSNNIVIKLLIFSYTVYLFQFVKPALVILYTFFTVPEYYYYLQVIIVIPGCLILFFIFWVYYIFLNSPFMLLNCCYEIVNIIAYLLGINFFLPLIPLFEVNDVGALLWVIVEAVYSIYMSYYTVIYNFVIEICFTHYVIIQDRSFFFVLELDPLDFPIFFKILQALNYNFSTPLFLFFCFFIEAQNVYTLNYFISSDPFTDCSSTLMVVDHKTLTIIRFFDQLIFNVNQLSVDSSAPNSFIVDNTITCESESSSSADSENIASKNNNHDIVGDSNLSKDKKDDDSK